VIQRKEGRATEFIRVIQRERRPTSLSEWPRERETSGSTNEFIGKTTTIIKYKAIIKAAKASAATTSICSRKG
jgi:hypothetical protein